MSWPVTDCSVNTNKVPAKFAAGTSESWEKKIKKVIKISLYNTPGTQ
jgi:hypothetical protein